MLQDWRYCLFQDKHFSTNKSIESRRVFPYSPPMRARYRLINGIHTPTVINKFRYAIMDVLFCRLYCRSCLFNPVIYVGSASKCLVSTLEPSMPIHSFSGKGHLNQSPDKQRVLMHGHQGWNVRHGLCHIYMIYVYIWVVYSFCLFCCLFIIVTTQFVALYKHCKPKPKLFA